METQTKLGFTVLQIVDIPDAYLTKGVKKMLSGREMYVDTDTSLEEQVFSSGVFDDLIEDFQSGTLINALKNEADFLQVRELAEDLKDYHLVRITKI